MNLVDFFKFTNYIPFSCLFWCSFVWVFITVVFFCLNFINVGIHLSECSLMWSFIWVFISVGIHLFRQALRYLFLRVHLSGNLSLWVSVCEFTCQSAHVVCILCSVSKSLCYTFEWWTECFVLQIIQIKHICPSLWKH